MTIINLPNIWEAVKLSCRKDRRVRIAARVYSVIYMVYIGLATFLGLMTIFTHIGFLTGLTNVPGATRFSKQEIIGTALTCLLVTSLALAFFRIQLRKCLDIVKATRKELSANLALKYIRNWRTICILAIILDPVYLVSLKFPYMAIPIFLVRCCLLMDFWGFAVELEEQARKEELGTMIEIHVKELVSRSVKLSDSAGDTV